MLLTLEVGKDAGEPDSQREVGLAFWVEMEGNSNMNDFVVQLPVLHAWAWWGTGPKGPISCFPLPLWPGVAWFCGRASAWSCIGCGTLDPRHCRVSVVPISDAGTSS